MPTTERPTTLGYQPGLDGLRGLALLAIVVYHSGIDLAPGAFLSVSTFFTLSGFLITALLVAEHERNGRISLRQFWDRRLRRLMPAAVAAVLAIAAAALVLADGTQWIRLRADALAALGYVANWRFIAAGDTYGAAFAAPSPYTHFWTLAIEEQFYLLLPVVVIGALAIGRGSRRVVATTLAAIAVGSVLWANHLVSSGVSINRLYFGTDVRIPELVAGALAGLWWMRRTEPISVRARQLARWLGALALAAMVVMWATADLTDTAYYRGGLALYSALTFAVIVAALQPTGPVRALLGWAPLRTAGVLSYAAYLIHFPVLIWLQQHTDLAGAARLGIAVPLTFGLAHLSGRWFEQPIRSGELLGNRGAPFLLVGSALVAMALVVGLTAVADPVDAVDLQAAQDWQKFQQQTAAQEASTAPRIAPYGDSTALMTGRGLNAVSRTDPSAFVAGGGWAELGCGLVTGGLRRTGGRDVPFEDECVDWVAHWAETARGQPADIALIQLGPWEVVDQQLVAGGPFLNVGDDPELEAVIETNLREAVEVLLADNEIVVLVSPPDVEFGRVDGRSPQAPLPESDPARMARVREIFERVAAGSERVTTVDLAGWIAQRDDDTTLRPDGVHFTERSAALVAAWLGPELVDIYADQTGRRRSAVRPVR